MKAVVFDTGLSLVPECEAEVLALAEWKARTADHVFGTRNCRTGSALLADLGERAVACREPINVTSRHPEPAVRLIANFADTPFELDGERYRSVESFWQGLKFDSPEERRAMAGMNGAEARGRGAAVGYGTHVGYRGAAIAVGTADHWDLMERACRAKFMQDRAAREALLGTAPRPLEHRVRHDSRTIPGVIMAEIWMRIRTELLDRDESSG